MNVHGSTQHHISTVSDHFWRDSLFWLAAGAAPLGWAALLIAGVPLATGWPQAQTLFWAVVAYPILEEIVFRGGLQTFLREKSGLSRSYAGISIANLITSICFAAAHLINQPPVWAALVFFPSLIFGAARDRYDGLPAPIALHALYNLGFVLLFVRQ